MGTLLERDDLPERVRRETSLLRVDSLWEQGKRNDALAALSALIEEHPGEWRLYLSRADCALSAGDLVAARAAVDEARRMAPEALGPVRYALRVAWQAEEWLQVADLAVLVRERFIAAGITPPRWVAHVRGGALCELGRWAEALTELGSVGEERTATTIHMQAVALMGLHRYREARDGWIHVLDLDPSNNRARIGLGHAELELLNLDEAHRQFARTAAVSDPDPTLFTDLAVLCQERGATGEAVQWAQRAASCGGDQDPHIIQTLFFLVRECGRSDIAEPWVALYEERWPERVPVHEALPEDFAWEPYRNGPLSLPWLAHALGISLPEAWSRIADDSQPGQAIRVRQPDRAGDCDGTVTAGVADTVAPDLISLLTLDVIGRLDLLSSMYKRVIVTDLFVKVLREQARHIEDPALRLRLYRILKFLRKEDVVVYEDAQVREEHAPPAVVTGPISPLARIPLATAYATTAPLYTDDIVLQDVHRSRLGKAFGTFHLLGAARAKDLIDGGEYERSVRELLVRGYSLPADPEGTLTRAISGALNGRLAAERDGKAAQALLARIWSPHSLRPDRACRLLANALEVLLLDSVLGSREARGQWAFELLDAAHAGDSAGGWTHATIRDVVRLLLNGPSDEATAGGAQVLYQWAEERHLAPEVLLRPVAQALRLEGRGAPGRAGQLADVLTAHCPDAFRSLVKSELG